MLGRPDHQGKMSSRLHQLTAVAALAAWFALSSCSLALAQSDDADPEMQIQRLENQLRQLTGQNEELQYRNRQLEERLRQLQGGAQAAPGAAQAAPQPNIAAAPVVQTAPTYGQPQQPGYGQPQPGYVQRPAPAQDAPIAQDAPPAGPQGRRRGDAFDPSQSPGAPGAPQALGGGQLPVSPNGGRGAGQPLDLANSAGSRYPQGGATYQGGATNPQGGAGYPQSGAAYPQGGASPPVNPNAGGGALATLPPTNSPRDEYDLGIGYMQRQDYALAEQTMRSFAEKYPGDALFGDSQYWLGESLFRQQRFRDAAEVFLNVTSKYDKSAKAPDALLRLGQSLAALKEKEAACAAFGEVTRKYPRASTGVKTTVDREQKRVKC
jgi:tol-pal system protein YbgF